MKRIAPLLLCLALPVFGGDAEIDRLVDRLFAPDPEARAAARRELLALGDGTLEKVLARIEARQPAGNVVRIHAVKDLQAEEEWWKLALVRIQAAAGGTDRVQVHEQNGAFIVVAPQAVQERVAGELAAMRRFLGRYVQLEARVLRFDTAPAELPVDLAAEDVAPWLERHRAEVTTAPRMTCRNGQKATVTILNEVSYVADFDIEIAQGTCIADPVIDVVQEGLALDLRPVAADDGGVDVALQARLTELTRPLKTMKLPLPVGPGTEIQVPETRTTGITRLLACRPGRVTVVDVGGGRVLFLAAQIITLDEIVAPPGGHEEPR